MTQERFIRLIMLRILLVPLGLAIALTGSCLYQKFHYLNELKNITPSQKISIVNYHDLPSLVASLPTSQKLVTESDYRLLKGNDKVKRITPTDNHQTVINIYFQSPDTEDNAEKRSAVLTYSPPKPLDFSKIVIFTSLSVSENIIGHGYRQSRVQFELEDEQGNKMRGPKIPLSTKPREKTYLMLRPTVDEPIPTGSFNAGFNLKGVSKVKLIFILAHYPDGISAFPISGRINLDTIYLIPNPQAATNFFGQPNIQRITRDNPNFLYSFRKIGWEKESHDFFVGMNYPWHNYGWDVGQNPYGQPANTGWSSREEELKKDFTIFKDVGLSPIRIYLFFDLRTGLEYTDGKLAGFDQYVANDIETIIKVAGETGIKINLVLFDFSIADGQGAPYAGEHPELIFSDQKYSFLKDLMIPLMRNMERWNNKYGKPIFAIEPMNEPENMTALIIPGYFESLKVWLKDLTNIIHQETSFKVTLGSHSIVDMQRWWSGLEIDIWQFHSYKYMAYEHDQTPQDTPRENIKISGSIFCGEMQPDNMAENIETLKNNGYNGVLFWSWNTSDGFGLRNTDQFKELTDWIKDHNKQ